VCFMCLECVCNCVGMQEVVRLNAGGSLSGHLARLSHLQCACLRTLLVCCVCLECMG